MGVAMRFRKKVNGGEDGGGNEIGGAVLAGLRRVDVGLLVW